MKKQIATIVMSSALLLSGCASWCDECADGSCEVTSKVVLPAHALFAFDSAELTSKDIDALAPVVERMTEDKTEKVTYTSKECTFLNFDLIFCIIIIIVRLNQSI